MNDSEVPISDELRNVLSETFRSEDDARNWLEQPVQAFAGLTPADMLRQGRSAEIVTLLTQLNLGFSL